MTSKGTLAGGLSFAAMGGLFILLFAFQNCAPSQTAFEDASQGPEQDVLKSVDKACEYDQTPAPVLTPFLPLRPLDVSAGCKNGFEVSRLREHQLTFGTLNASGSQTRKMALEIATYTAEDTVHLYAEDAAGNKTTLFKTCRLRTWDKGDPTGGSARPPDETLRQYRFTLPAGTKRLVLDNSLAKTPTYIKIVGLCDFDLRKSIVVDAAAASRLSLYRTVAD